MTDDSSAKGFFSRLTGSLSRKSKNGSEAVGKNLAKKSVFNVAETHRFPTWKQWKQMPHILSKPEKIISLVSLILVIASIGTLVGWFYYTYRTLAPSTGGEYTEGLIGTPQFINPLFSGSSDVDSDLTALIYSGLMRWDQEDGLVPDLAEQYSISEDQLTYTFTLREDAKWHDGNPVTASDVIFTIQSIKNLEYKSPLEVSLRGITAAQIDERTITFTLEEPFFPFLSVLTVGILPAHHWQEIPPKNVLLADMNLRPIGSGPYQFEKFFKDKKGNILSYTLTRNKDYYGGDVKIDTLTFKFYSDTISLMDALENKNVEGASFVPNEYIDELSEKKHINLYYPSLPQYTALFFNEENNDILEDDDVRQALALAINKQQIVDEVLKSRATVIHGPILEGYTGHHAEIAKIDQDLDAARTLLDEADWDFIDGNDARIKGATSDDEEPQNLNIVITTVDQPNTLAVAEMIQSQWREIGVATEIIAAPAELIDEQIIKPRDYQILLYGEILGIDPDPYPFWHSSQINAPGLNLAMYSNRDADTLLEEARALAGGEERTAKYIEFQNMLAEDLAAIFLYQPTYTYAVVNKVKGVDLWRLIVPADRFSNILDWYINTRHVFR